MVPCIWSIDLWNNACMLIQLESVLSLISLINGKTLNLLCGPAYNLHHLYTLINIKENFKTHTTLENLLLFTYNFNSKLFITDIVLKPNFFCVYLYIWKINAMNTIIIENILPSNSELYINLYLKQWNMDKVHDNHFPSQTIM